MHTPHMHKKRLLKQSRL